MLDNYDSVGTYCRTFEHKGIDPQCLLERDMVPSEIEYVKNTWRLHWFAYSDWKVLIQDEWKLTQNKEWINRLLKASCLKESIEEILKIF